MRPRDASKPLAAPASRRGLTRALVPFAATLAAAILSWQSGSSAAEPYEVTMRDMQRQMAEGRETSRSLTERYLARIEAIDRKGPELRSVLEINPDAQSIAAELDEERRRGHVRGPLHGIPILLKDNIATGDRMLTTAGSLALADRPAPRDAFIVRRLREAGAVILGKTNLSEWANFRSTRSSSGWSARGGQTRNPYVLDHSPSGSSSGSAVAVSAGLAAAAVGTETDGSIVSPSSANGVVGLKPTVGLVSRTGIVPISHSQDTAGPIARSVADAAMLLAALAGPDPADPTTTVHPRTPSDYANALNPAALKGARLGVVRERFFGHSQVVDALADRAIDVMRRQGATIVDPVVIDTLGSFDPAEFQVLLYEFPRDLERFFTWWGPGAPLRTVADIVAFNSAHADSELPYFGQEILERAGRGGPLSDLAYRETLARIRRLAGEDGIDAAMRRHRLDALVAPTSGPAWPIDYTRGDSGSAVRPSPATIAAVAGYPHITVPMGHDRSLPIGLSFFGRAWSEPRLIGLAFAYEQASRERRPPAFLPTLAQP
ncbi:MAG: amidase [Vicinamibacterales bacterium]